MQMLESAASCVYSAVCTLVHFWRMETRPWRLEPFSRHVEYRPSSTYISRPDTGQQTIWCHRSRPCLAFIVDGTGYGVKV